MYIWGTTASSMVSNSPPIMRGIDEREKKVGEFKKRNFCEENVLPFLIIIKKINVFCKSLVSIVEGGHRAIVFNRLVGIKSKIYGEGTHFLLPWFEWPVIYDVRSKPRNIQSLTGSRGILFILNY